MKIKIGDWIKVNMSGFTYREGIIKDIKIGTCESDPAGELGYEVQELDTKLNYLGSVGYGDNYRCYFNQIEEVQSGKTED